MAIHIYRILDAVLLSVFSLFVESMLSISVEYFAFINCLASRIFGNMKIAERVPNITAPPTLTNTAMKTTLLILESEFWHFDCSPNKIV